jgi:hypothetical protein
MDCDRMRLFGWKATAEDCEALFRVRVSLDISSGEKRKCQKTDGNFCEFEISVPQGGYNMDDRYSYTEKKFSEARRVLMLPAPGKEALAISEALQDCQLGLQNIAHLNHDLDERVLGYISRLRELTDKRKSFGDNDKQELCDLINHLAYYFHDRWKQV